jgi:hypothetical protein
MDPVKSLMVLSRMCPCRIPGMPSPIGKIRIFNNTVVFQQLRRHLMPQLFVDFNL